MAHSFASLASSTAAQVEATKAVVQAGRDPHAEFSVSVSFLVWVLV